MKFVWFPAPFVFNFFDWYYANSMNVLDDPEMLAGLAEEMKTLESQLAPVVAELKKNNSQPELFEKFGQIIDRIYGTAATFGLKELASYCGTLKKICYECAKLKSPNANARVLRLLEAYLQNLANLIKGITDPVVAKQINHAMHLEEQKAKKIEEEIFKYVKK